MPKYPTNRIYMGFGEKSFLSPNFCPYYSMAIWRLWAKILINTLFPKFGFFPSSKHDIHCFYAILLVTLRETHKKSKLIMINILFHFLHFCQKPIGLTSVFRCRNEFCIPKYINNRIFMAFREKSFFPQIFALSIVWRSGGYGSKY